MAATRVNGAQAVERWFAKVLAAAVSASVATAACASGNDTLPPMTIAVRNTFDVFHVPFGIEPGTTVLNKIQLSGTLRGDQFGLDGWSVHAQLFRFDGQSLSRRLGDIQTADNIETVPVTRLFEAYVTRLWGRNNHSIAVRAGFIDLNSQFDPIDAASMMLSSSHGIGPDLSLSGRNGPSIYPVTALGSTITWVHSPTWTFRLGMFEALPENLDRPRAFFAERFKPNDGALIIGQLDQQVSKESRLEAGVWAYTAAQNGPKGQNAHDQGAYISYEAPLDILPHLNFWIRAGFANGHAQPVAGYLGGGVVEKGAISGRQNDRIGFAIAHAIIGDTAADAFGLHRAETSFELTYQAILGRNFVVQPNFAFVHHPTGATRAPDSLGVGLRFVFVTAYPIKMEASDPGDPRFRRTVHLFPLISYDDIER